MPLPITVPAGLVLLGAIAEGSYAWFDGDFFYAMWPWQDTDQQVALLNNYFQQLDRSARTAGLSRQHPAMQELDATMASWWSFKQQYGQDVLKFMPWGRDWEGELNLWHTKFDEHRAALSAVAKQKLEEELRRRGVDTRLLRIEEPGLTERLEELLAEGSESLRKTVRTAVFWPVLGVGVLTLGVVWIVTRAAQPRAA